LSFRIQTVANGDGLPDQYPSGSPVRSVDVARLELRQLVVEAAVRQADWMWRD